MPITRRSLLRTAAMATVGVTAAPGISFAEARRLRLSRYRLPWNTDRTIRVVQLTDLHFGSSTPRGNLERAADWAWRADPSLVVLTGDYVNYTLRFLQGLRRFIGLLPKPCVAILGNHDHWSGANAVKDTIERGGAHVLQNESTKIEGNGFNLRVIGVDDGYTDHADLDRAFDGVDDPAGALVLTHFPNTADDIAARGGRLILAGHTHGGQLSLPVLTPAVARLIGARYVSGWYPVAGAKLYVNAGLGSSLGPIRAGADAIPEVAVFELVPRAEIDRDHAREIRSGRGEIKAARVVETQASTTEL